MEIVESNGERIAVISHLDAAARVAKAAQDANSTDPVASLFRSISLEAGEMGQGCPDGLLVIFRPRRRR